MVATRLNAARKERAQGLKRRLYKVCQYIRGITYLIQEAKRLFLIPHRWVTDTFTGTGEFDLCKSAHDAVSRGHSRGTAHHPPAQPTVPYSVCQPHSIGVDKRSCTLWIDTHNDPVDDE